jgi:Holliday junction resolvase-like predicted endonuclease
MLVKAAGIEEVDGEVVTDKGRIDAVLKHKNFIVIVEIKYSKDNKLEEKLKEALRQIKDTKYYEKYSNNNPTHLGIVFGENKEIACKFDNN